jgi:hypothetical protein
MKLQIHTLLPFVFFGERCAGCTILHSAGESQIIALTKKGNWTTAGINLE